jgi:hypothetical protein
MAAGLLVLLWVTGYWRTQSIKMRNPPLGCSIWSGRGAIAVSFNNQIPASDPDRWVYESYPVGRDHAMLLGFEYQPGLPPISWTIFIPNWFTIGVFTTIGAMPWLRWRFTLRAMLTVTTMVAVALGIIVWSMRVSR